MSTSTEVRGATLPSLTGLRWTAAALVFGFHVAVVGYFGGPAGTVVSTVFGHGSTGVALFFVLSGFVLAWSHDDHASARAFYLRRFARVWPSHAVWVVVAMCLAAGFAAIRHPGAELLGDVANLALVSAWAPGWWQAGNPVAWSLVCEAFFYAIFPLLYRCSRSVDTRGRYLVSAAGLVLAIWLLPELLQWVRIVGSANAASHHPLARWPEFVLGLLLARAMRDGAWRGLGLRTGVGIVALCYVVACLIAHDHVTETLIMVPAHMVLISALVRCDLTARPTGLHGRTAQHLGTISFAFYLCHLLVIGVLGALCSSGHPRFGVVPGLGLCAAALVVSLALAELTHGFVERPAQRWLVSKLRRRPPVAVSSSSP